MRGLLVELTPDGGFGAILNEVEDMDAYDQQVCRLIDEGKVEEFDRLMDTTYVINIEGDKLVFVPAIGPAPCPSVALTSDMAADWERLKAEIKVIYPAD